ncbi:MAG: immune inhibitor A, partial [Elusimicrobia bacterium]|nr:immune inhibitor A [Elusimicrobiota bacterium]
MKRLAADTQVIFRRLKPAAALLFLMLCVPESLFAGSPPITCTIATNDYSGGVEEISTYEPIAKIKMVSGAGAVAANLTAIKIENIGAVLPSNISKVAVWIRQADPVSWTGGTVETFFGAASAWVGSTITVSGTFSVTASLTWNIYITYNLASGLTPGTSVALRLNPAALTYGAVDSTVYPLTSSTRPVVSASIMSLPYTVDFESDPVWTAFSTAAVSTNWERGPPTGVGPSSAYGGTNAYGTDLDANYGVFAKTHLTTRIINLSANSTLNFHHWNRDELAYDGGCVLISTDTAWGWTQLTPVGGYPSAAVAGLDIPDVGDNRPGYSSTVVADWRAAEFDLSAYTGKKVRLRFYFASDTSIVNPGWYIDDFYIAKTGVDLTLNQSDIDLKPPSAEFNEVVAVSATIRNIGTSNGEKIDIKQETAGGSNTYIDNLRPQGQGFVIGTPMSITAVGLNALDYGAVGDVTTIKITTGTTSLPYIGSMGAKVLAEKAITISNTSLAWVKAVFDEPVFLPVLPSGDAYWMVAYNPSAATDGAGWNRSDSDLYAPAARASSA